MTAKVTGRPPRMVEATSTPVVYVDDIGKVEVEGANARVTFVEYRTVGAERLAIPCLQVVRPLTSCDGMRFNRLIQMAIGIPESGGRH